MYSIAVFFLNCYCIIALGIVNICDRWILVLTYFWFWEPKIKEVMFSCLYLLFFSQVLILKRYVVFYWIFLSPWFVPPPSIIHGSQHYGYEIPHLKHENVSTLFSLHFHLCDWPKFYGSWECLPSPHFTMFP